MPFTCHLLLDANPLLGFATLRDPRGVVLNGAWHDADELRHLRLAPDSPSGRRVGQRQTPEEGER